MDEISFDTLNRSIRLPVVIWGTQIASQICYRILKDKKICISAVGDNNTQKWGEKFHDIIIMSADTIKEKYADAIIVIGSFFYDTTDVIIAQLKTINKNFTFCRFQQIEYLYETEYLNRMIYNKKKYYQIIYNISNDSQCAWKRKTNKDVMTEYHYILQDPEASDLKEILNHIYGIKTLYLIVSTYKVIYLLSIVNEVIQYDNIGHLVIVLDDATDIGKVILKKLTKKIFYIICDETKIDLISDLEEMGFLVESRKLQSEIFINQDRYKHTILTENVIIYSVLRFLGDKRSENYKSMNKKIKPVYIVQLFNGLANQMLMYLFGRFLEEETDRIVIFDDTVLNLDMFDRDENIRRMTQWNKLMSVEEVEKMVTETREKNSFYRFKRAEIAEVFDIPIRLLSDYFDDELWKRYLNKVKEKISNKYSQSFPLGQVLLEYGVNISVVRDTIMPNEFYGVKNCFCFDTYILDKVYGKKSMTNFILNNQKNTYYLGIWATGRNEDWLLHNRKWVSEKFHFHLKLDGKNQYYVKMMKQFDGIIVHVRRGDFVYGKLAVDAEYFKNAICLIDEEVEYKNKKYFIFSDDLDWCQQNLRLLGIDRVKNKTVFINGNRGENSYIDMFLMSLGKVIIPSPGSSFGYMAILLSKTVEKSINIPKYLYEMRQNTFEKLEVIVLKD